jgi:hypothetical protein
MQPKSLDVSTMRSQVTMVTLILGQVSDQSLASPQGGRRRKWTEQTPHLHQVPTPPRQHRARTMRGEAASPLEEHWPSSQIKRMLCVQRNTGNCFCEMILLPLAWKDKQVTDKFSKVTEFPTCGIQNQIYKASCHISKAVRREKLHALSYKET